LIDISSIHYAVAPAANKLHLWVILLAIELEDSNIAGHSIKPGRRRPVRLHCRPVASTPSLAVGSQSADLFEVFGGDMVAWLKTWPTNQAT
jgi:hypothetical protein